MRFINANRTHFTNNIGGGKERGGAGGKRQREREEKKVTRVFPKNDRMDTNGNGARF